MIRKRGLLLLWLVSPLLSPGLILARRPVDVQSTCIEIKVSLPRFASVNVLMADTPEAPPLQPGRLGMLVMASGCASYYVRKWAP
jgi:hypothetical protein